MKRSGPDHPKTLALEGALGIGHALAVGHLELLFHWVAKYAPEGDVGRWTNVQIAKGCAWDGDPDRFVEALLATGWLDSSAEHRLLVHDWGDHADEAVRKALGRRGLTPIPTPSRRRLDVVETRSGPPEPEPEPEPEPVVGALPRASAPSRSAPSEPAVLTFPTTGKVKQWELSRAQTAEWETLYPNLDVLGECRKALAWINAHQERRKTARGMAAFLVNWLNREVDSPRRSSRTLAPPERRHGQVSPPTSEERRRKLALLGKDPEVASCA